MLCVAVYALVVEKNKGYNFEMTYGRDLTSV